MSHVKNALKLPGDHADLNLNQKIMLWPLFNVRKSN